MLWSLLDLLASSLNPKLSPNSFIPPADNILPTHTLTTPFLLTLSPTLVAHTFHPRRQLIQPSHWTLSPHPLPPTLSTRHLTPNSHPLSHPISQPSRPSSWLTLKTYPLSWLTSPLNSSNPHLTILSRSYALYALMSTVHLVCLVLVAAISSNSFTNFISVRYFINFIKSICVYGSTLTLCVI